MTDRTPPGAMLFLFAFSNVFPKATHRINWARWLLNRASGAPFWRLYRATLESQKQRSRVDGSAVHEIGRVPSGRILGTFLFASSKTHGKL